MIIGGREWRTTKKDVISVLMKCAEKINKCHQITKVEGITFVTGSELAVANWGIQTILKTVPAPELIEDDVYAGKTVGGK